MAVRKQMRLHTKPKIQLCPTCGRMRRNHPGARLYECPVPKEVTEAIREFAAKNGKNWKSKLCMVWEKGYDDELLRQARNLIGPHRIYKIKL